MHIRAVLPNAINRAVITIFNQHFNLINKIISFRIAVFFSVLRYLSVNAQNSIKINGIYDNNIYTNLVDFMFEVNQADAAQNHQLTD